MVEAATLIQYAVNGIAFGAILALGAIGLSLVYGILGLSNFAHGDLLTFGAFIALFFGVAAYPGNQHLVPWALAAGGALVVLALLDHVATRRLTSAERATGGAFGLALLAATGIAWRSGISMGTTNAVLVLATLLAIACTVALVVGLEFAIWRPLRRKRATLLTLVIVSVGVSLVVRNGLQQYFGGDSKQFQRPQLEAHAYFGVLVSPAQQITLVLALVLIAAVHVFLRYTKTGKSMRAVADNLDLARVSGIDVDRVVVYVWAIAGALVAVAGVLLALTFNNNMYVNMGFGLIIPLFASVILGGIGSPYGAMLGGFVVGVAMKMSSAVPFLGSEYELASAFVILAAMLLIRPQGLLGVKH
ncbi:MAG TPA: branched-chain amino acid ABC transporter permease [Candidatus Thermoplasmatota archaeon]|nr:branched-chain amino acid ABC transporter permease [Candidatus Thermoplasmatota archaeon]